MSFSKQEIKVIQQILNSHDNINIAVDGIKGPNTIAATHKINQISPEWSDDRKLTAVVQYAATKHDIEGGPIDGYWGPQTNYAYRQLKKLTEEGNLPEPWRDEQPKNDPSVEWPAQRTQDMMNFYGDVGDQKNMVDVKVPYTLKLTWNKSTKIKQFKCHKLVKPSIERVLERVLEHYGYEEIKRLELDSWSGCLNVRKKRGGSTWSVHSWGAAIDWMSDKNKLEWGADKAKMAQPEYDFWWKCWEDEGWISLGRCKGYDFMHVQAAIVECDNG